MCGASKTPKLIMVHGISGSICENCILQAAELLSSEKGDEITSGISINIFDEYKLN
jgi:predicted alpha/beta-fold hydrolase